MFSVSPDWFSGCLSEVLFEEQRDSRVWVCCVHQKFFCSDTLLIKGVDLFLSEQGFLSGPQRCFHPPGSRCRFFFHPDFKSTGSWFLKGMNGNEFTSWCRCGYWCEKLFVYPNFLRWKEKVTQSSPEAAKMKSPGISPHRMAALRNLFYI